MNLSLFRQAAARLYESRPDLRAAFPGADSPEYWAWCNSHGFYEDPDLGPLAPPLPPENLRCLVGAGPSESDFLNTGANIFLGIARLAGLERSNSILDFGCGCGRITRFLSFYVPGAPIAGVDVEPRHIPWVSCNLSFGAFTLIDGAPPLPFRPRRFDTIFCISVFSHLPYSAQLSWMTELSRALAPEGTNRNYHTGSEGHPESTRRATSYAAARHT